MLRYRTVWSVKQFKRKVHTLSGGEKQRVALIKNGMLLKDPIV